MPCFIDLLLVRHCEVWHNVESASVGRNGRETCSTLKPHLNPVQMKPEQFGLGQVKFWTNPISQASAMIRPFTNQILFILQQQETLIMTEPFWFSNTVIIDSLSISYCGSFFCLRTKAYNLQAALRRASAILKSQKRTIPVKKAKAKKPE